MSDAREVLGEELYEQVLAIAGAGGVDPLVRRAVTHELQHHELTRVLDEMEAAVGPLPEELVAEAERVLARFLILDATAVGALSEPKPRGVESRRALAIMRVAERERATLVIPLPVLAEVYTGRRSDAGVDRVVTRLVRSVAADLDTVRLAGRLRHRAGRGSAVDAIVAATAVRLGSSLIATGDPGDLRALVADHREASVWPLVDER